ncbi:MAG: LysR family transcriptional regulator [Candidatus Dormibacteraceae bacterium]
MFRPSFTMEQVRTFLAVAEREHVTRAAEEIHLSQGAVTQQIQLFERAVGLPLFERVGRSVRLTDAGSEMMGACRALIRAAEAVVEAADALRSIESGSVHVGASQTAASYYLPAALASFLQRHPGVRMTVVPGNTAGVWTQVAEGVLDCGLVEGDLPSSELTAIALAEDELVLVAGPANPLALTRRLEPRRLAGAVYLARERGSGTEALVRERLGPVYEQLRRVELGQLDAVRAAAVAGAGIAALPRIAVAAELRSGELTVLGIAPWHRTIHAVRRPGAGGPAFEAFWKILKSDQLITSK